MKEKMKKFDKKMKEKMFPSKGGNDKKWYTNVKGVLDSITLPQFLIRKGMPTLGYPNSIGIPSVAAIMVQPVLGSDDQLAITNSVDKLYSNLRRGNTGAATYTKQDLKKYLFNLSQAIIADRMIRRAYGVCNNYSGVDSTLPIAYFKAMGLDYDSFKDNMANLRSFINNNSIRLHSILAGKCDLFERRAWMFDHIFRDGETSKSQDFLFTIPETLTYWSYADNAYKTVAIPLYTGGTIGRGYAAVIANITTLMYDITNSNKVNYIAADLIKAYGMGQVRDYFTVIPENYKVNPVYNEEVLNELQNAKLCGGVQLSYSDDASGNLVEQADNNTSLSFGLTDPGYVEYINNNYINYYKNKIDIIDYAVATRLSPRMAYNINTNHTDIVSYGTEIPMYVMFVVPTDSSYFATNAGDGLDTYNLTRVTFDPFRVEIYGSITRGDVGVNLWSYFDWAPMFVTCARQYYDNTGTLQSNNSAIYPHFDFDNYAKLDSVNQLSNIHNACNLSVWYWPDVIKDQKVITIADLK